MLKFLFIFCTLISLQGMAIAGSGPNQNSNSNINGNLSGKVEKAEVLFRAASSSKYFPGNSKGKENIRLLGIGANCAGSTTCASPPNNSSGNSSPRKGRPPRREISSRFTYCENAGGCESGGGAAANLSESSEVSYSGAAQSQLEQNYVGQTMYDMPTISESSIGSSRQILSSWQTDMAARSSVPPEEQQKFRQDSRLVGRAEQAILNGKIFSTEEALQANDPAIKSDLYLAAAAQEVQESLSQKYHRLEAQKNIMAANGEESANRSTNLGKIKDEKDLSATMTGEKSNESSLSLAKVAEKNSAVADENKSKELKSSEESITAKRASASSLREALRKQLEAQLKGKDPINDKNFQPGLDSNDLHISDLNNENKDALKGSKNLDDFLDDVKVRVAKADFSLSGSETDREIASMVQEAGMGVGIGGLLDEQSMDLFKRVRETHRNCEERHCVSRK